LVYAGGLHRPPDFPKNPTSKKSAVIGIELSQSLDCDRHTKSQRLVEIVSLQEQLTQQKENLGGGEKCEALQHGTISYPEFSSPTRRCSY
jgi:hypothetical protein